MMPSSAPSAASTGRPPILLSAMIRAASSIGVSPVTVMTLPVITLRTVILLSRYVISHTLRLVAGDGEAREEVLLGDDAHHPPALVDDGQAADAPLAHELQRVGHRQVRRRRPPRLLVIRSLTNIGPLLWSPGGPGRGAILRRAGAAAS